MSIDMKLSFVVIFTIPTEFHLNIINRKYQTDEKSKEDENGKIFYEREIYK